MNTGRHGIGVSRAVYWGESEFFLSSCRRHSVYFPYFWNSHSALSRGQTCRVFSQRDMQCRWKAWLHTPQATVHVSLEGVPYNTQRKNTKDALELLRLADHRTSDITNESGQNHYSADFKATTGYRNDLNGDTGEVPATHSHNSQNLLEDTANPIQPQSLSTCLSQRTEVGRKCEKPDCMTETLRKLVPPQCSMPGTAHLAGLALNAQIHDVVPADRAVVDGNVP